MLGGLSLGGYLSLAFYLAHPERVAALVLADTGPGFRNDEARQRWNDRAYRAGRPAGRKAVATRRRPSLALAARGMLAQRDASVIDSLPQVNVPTLVLVGAEDSAFLGAASYMAAKIPGPSQVTLDGPVIWRTSTPGKLSTRGREFSCERSDLTGDAVGAPAQRAHRQLDLGRTGELRLDRGADAGEDLRLARRSLAVMIRL